MSKICIIGDRDSVMGFMAVGFAVYEASDAKSAADILVSLANDKENAIIFIMENYAVSLDDLISKYKNQPIPAIIPIPSRNGSCGYAMESIKRASERALGADILFK